MLYLVALIFPPIAILLAGKPFQAILNFVIWICGFLLIVPFFVAAIHGLVVVHNHYADKRTARLERAVRESRA